MEIGLEGEPLGAPAYHPRALLSVWLYGFMTGVRSSRKLEAACRDQIPYLWLTGWQHPDHNTLWRFYQGRGQVFVMPERYHPGVTGPYFKDRFTYEEATDSYLCPQGQRLPFRGLRRNNGKVPGPFRVYRASRTVCRACPAYGICTKDAHAGRALWIGPTDTLLRTHRQWMTTEAARR